VYTHTHLYKYVDVYCFSGRSPVDSRGGQLQIAGVVVGSWGGNTQSHNQRAGRMAGGPNSQPPQVMSVGPRRYFIVLLFEVPFLCL